VALNISFDLTYRQNIDFKRVRGQRVLTAFEVLLSSIIGILENQSAHLPTAVLRVQRDARGAGEDWSGDREWLRTTTVEGLLLNELLYGCRSLAG
jgi:hypothetical protein